MKPKLLSALCISILLISCDYSKKSTDNARYDVFVPQFENVLNEEVPVLQSEQNVPAVGVGLIEDGKIKFLKIYGEHQKGYQAPENTIFNVASITKSVAAITVLKLVSQGQWHLDDPLFKYWVDPDISNNPLYKKITTRHCLTHTIGFKNFN